MLYELRVPRSGTYIMKPTASSEGAQLWDKKHPLTLSWFREAGPTTILNIIVDASVPLRGTIWGGSIARTRSSYSICLRSWVRGYGETP